MDQPADQEQQEQRQGSDNGENGDAENPPPPQSPDNEFENEIEDQHQQEDDLMKKRERRAKWECRGVVALAAVIVIVVVVTVSVLAVRNNNNNSEDEQADVPVPVPVTPSPTPAPSTRIIDPQEKLDFVRQSLGSNEYTQPYLDLLAGEDPETLDGKHDDPSEPSVVRAASWLVGADELHRDSNLIRRFALATIYYSNGGSNWTNSTNWLATDASHCKWYGVTCCGGYLDKVAPSCSDSGSDDDPGEVVSISLSNNNVVGNITNAYALLPELQALDLGYNSLVGTLPASMFGSLPRFMSLSVQHNQLSGTISKDLRKNKVLHTLFVQRNNFTGTWPNQFCSNILDKFGLDCDKVTCQSQDCCHPDVYCYYG